MLSTCVEAHVEWRRTPGMDAGPGALHQGWFARSVACIEIGRVDFSLVTFSLSIQRESDSRESAKLFCRRAAVMPSQMAIY
jgi:hypothetical protein